MPKTIQDTYVALSKIGTGIIWGEGSAPEDAIERLKVEALAIAQGYWSFAPETQLMATVVKIAAGHYWYHHEQHGQLAVDYDTDEARAYAEPVSYVKWDPHAQTQEEQHEQLAEWKATWERAVPHFQPFTVHPS